MQTGKLSDGTEVQYSELAAGGQIAIPDAEGNYVPAPAGELELEDGRIVVITEPGIIAEIKEAMKQDQSVEEMRAEIATLRNELATRTKDIATLTSAFNAHKAANEAVTLAFKEYLEAVSEAETGEVKKPKQSIFQSQIDKKTAAKAKAQAAFQAFAEKLKNKSK
ncbi:hypothetical protein [Chitinophaga sp. sic0106]|uniref:hypothetical protein n=1 Tax=Chitinophaga sp. sic0106 TaxID=2854785 RepID=UPI001C46AFE2|nr:hypothetical protein [Chitinophaga sp. sic0106]MBV7534050.1 hypothetical protein [Chitinophaga sp. sic0106]